MYVRLVRVQVAVVCFQVRRRAIVCACVCVCATGRFEYSRRAAVQRRGNRTCYSVCDALVGSLLFLQSCALSVAIVILVPVSVNNTSVRVTTYRWSHIVEYVHPRVGAYMRACVHAWATSESIET